MCTIPCAVTIKLPSIYSSIKKKIYLVLRKNTTSVAVALDCIYLSWISWALNACPGRSL